MVDVDVEFQPDNVVCKSLVKASASFSIWAYLVSVEDMAREMYTTGLHSCSGSLWSSTAPKPKDEASAEMDVSRLGSYKARTGLELRICFTSWKACSCALSQHGEVSLSPLGWVQTCSSDWPCLRTDEAH